MNLMSAALLFTISGLVFLTSATVEVCSAKLPHLIMDCGWHRQFGKDRACRDSLQGGCVANGWFEKIILEVDGPTTDAHQLCIEQGFEGADETMYGRSIGPICSYPGTKWPVKKQDRGEPNLQGAPLAAMKYQMVFKCKGARKCPVIKPTKR